MDISLKSECWLTAGQDSRTETPRGVHHGSDWRGSVSHLPEDHDVRLFAVEGPVRVRSGAQAVGLPDPAICLDTTGNATLATPSPHARTMTPNHAPSSRRPVLSQATRALTVTIAAVNERGESVPTAIAGEYPLTLYVDKREIVTLMTLGAAPEALAIGWLRNQRLVASLDELASVQVDWDVDAVSVTTRSGLVDADQRLGSRTVTTGCGQGTVFGNLMDEIDTITLPVTRRLSEATLYALMDAVRHHESIYKAAGAVHGCALARPTPDGCEILMFVEDVGRHNAVDAIAGQMWLDGLSGDDLIFYTTGRLTSEMVIKTAQMGIPFLVSRSGLTRMGWEIARKLGMTMIGRAQGRHYLLFSGQERFMR